MIDLATAMQRWSETTFTRYRCGPMPRRIEIELTSARPDGTWTWRAAGAREPKGVLEGSLLPAGAKIGSVLKADTEVELDGITVLGVTMGKEKAEKAGLLDLLPSDKPFEGVTQQLARGASGQIAATDVTAPGATATDGRVATPIGLRVGKVPPHGPTVPLVNDQTENEAAVSAADPELAPNVAPGPNGAVAPTSRFLRSCRSGRSRVG